MRILMSFVTGVGLAMLGQSLAASAGPEDDVVAIAAVKAEVQLLKSEMETMRADMSARVDGVSLQARALQERLTLLENGEAKQMPLIVR